MCILDLGHQDRPQTSPLLCVCLSVNVCAQHAPQGTRTADALVPMLMSDPKWIWELTLSRLGTA